MMSVTANYEGAFADLMQFINLLDRSPKFLILESLTAAPQQSGLTLSVSMKLNSFVRDEGQQGGAL
jgi:type IV pilus assembly protein PilO